MARRKEVLRPSGVRPHRQRYVHIESLLEEGGEGSALAAAASAGSGDSAVAEGAERARSMGHCAVGEELARLVSRRGKAVAQRAEISLRVHRYRLGKLMGRAAEEQPLLLEKREDEGDVMGDEDAHVRD